MLHLKLLEIFFELVVFCLFYLIQLGLIIGERFEFPLEDFFLFGMDFLLAFIISLLPRCLGLSIEQSSNRKTLFEVLKVGKLARLVFMNLGEKVRVLV